MIGEWLNKLWYVLVIEYYCAVRSDDVEDFYMNWEILNEHEMSRTRTLHTESETLWNNQM